MLQSATFRLGTHLGVSLRSTSKTPRPSASRLAASLSTSSNNHNTPVTTDVIQGPSLLRTSLDRPNPSLIHLPGLRSLPFWTQWDGTNNRVAYQDEQVTFCVEHLQAHWETLRDEYQTVSPHHASDYNKPGQQGAEEHLKLHEGTWDWHSYMLKGQVQGHFCAHFGETAQVLQGLRDEGLLFEGTPFGYTFFSTLHPNSKIAPHTSPMNFRLRIHLPLIVPPTSSESSSSSSSPACGIRVGPLVREWTPGQALVLDDAYRHAVWNETSSSNRVVLLVDIWHPDVTLTERRDIVEMFAEAAAAQARNAVWEG